MLARSKLISIHTMISKALIDSEVGHEDYTTIINEEEKYRRLKKDLRMMTSQRSNAQKNKLIEEVQRIGINETIAQSNGNIQKKKN